MKRITILGAGGHSKQCIRIAEKMKYTKIYIFDDIKQGEIYGYKILGKIEKSLNYDEKVHIAIGNNKSRYNLSKLFPLDRYENLYDPKFHGDISNIGYGNLLDYSSTFMGNSMGNFNIVNISSCISHDCEIGDFNHFSVKSTICGNVQVGSFNDFFASSTVIPGLK